MKRRTFLKSAAASMVVGSTLLGCESDDSPDSLAAAIVSAGRFGVGLFSIPEWLEQDFAGSLKKLADIGYRELEFYGPYSFSVQSAHDRWNEITPNLPFSGSGYFGHTAAEVRKIMDAYGLTSPSMHADLETLETNLGPLAEAANIMGQKYAGIAAIPEEMRQSLDDYKRIADRFNAIGRRMKEHGLQFLYHNHGYGLVEMEGEIPMRLILEQTDPDLVVMEMDVFWTTAGKADPIAYLNEYAGRYKLMHVKDMTELVHFSGDGGKPDEWIGLFPKMADAGAGVLDLEGILSAARKSGVDHFYLERDMASDPDKTLQVSFENLSSYEI